MLLEEDKEAIIRQNYYLKKHKDAAIKARFLRDKHILFLIAILLNLSLFIFLYFASSRSNLFKISVTGNNLLKKESVINLCGLKRNAKFWLISTSKIKKRLLKYPFIEKVKISKESNNILKIDIIEKRLFGYYYDKGQTKVWLNNSLDAKLEQNDLYLLAKIPLIVGFSEQQLQEIERRFVDLKDTTLNEISEIHHYPMSYDANFLEVIMRDGNYVFLSPAALKYLNSYYNIASVLENKEKESGLYRACLYFDEITKTGYRSACPWENAKDNTNKKVDTKE